MTVLFEQLDVAYAVVARTRFEDVAKRQRRQCSVAARAAAANDQPVAVGFATLDQITRAVNAIIHVDHSPLPVQPSPVIGAVAGASAVVHIQHAEATAGPILNREFESGIPRVSRPAVTDHYQWRTFVFGRLKI